MSINKLKQAKATLKKYQVVEAVKQNSCRVINVICKHRQKSAALYGGG